MGGDCARYLVAKGWVQPPGEIFDIARLDRASMRASSTSQRPFSIRNLYSRLDDEQLK